MAANKKDLPPKEALVFRNVLKNYETRQYKKGLKLAESILKNYPDHGETLALKGIFLNNLEKKEEGYEYVKKGLLKDLTSPICWHIYGLLHRADKNYEESAKCYVNALKFSKNDGNILRDLVILQTHLRHYDALVETRTKLLETQPQNSQNWIGLAVAYQFVNKPKEAFEVLEKCIENDVVVGTTPYEKSEFLLYQNLLLEESGDFQRALDHLKSIEFEVTDKKAWKEKHALFLVKLGQKEEGEIVYRGLISENPNNVDYVKALLALQAEDKKSKVLSELAVQYPRSRTIENLILDHAEGEAFKVKVDASLQHGLRKGIPSLFASMKKYYSVPEKKAVIEQLVAGYAASLQKEGTFGTQDTKEPPTAFLWTLYYLAKQHDLFKDYARALDYINQAIAHTPTVVELYMTKGRILKHSGKPQEASQAMNEAREIDLQDRFINSKAAKYMFRAGQMAEAERTLGLFTRKNVGALQDLTEMQCQWVMIERGNAYLNAQDYGRALKSFHSVEKFYNDYFEDQFDFHNYCLRKLTLRGYVDTLRWEDRVKEHPYYLKAIAGAVRAYLALADQPKEHEVGEEGMTEAELKKARNKARKAALKIQQDQEAKKAALKEEALKHKHDKKPIDTDPLGESYLQKDPLVAAAALVGPVGPLADPWAFEIYLRQRKYLLALQVLLRLSSDSNTERLQKAVESDNTLDPKIKQVLDANIPKKN